MVVLYDTHRSDSHRKQDIASTLHQGAVKVEADAALDCGVQLQSGIEVSGSCSSPDKRLRNEKLSREKMRADRRGSLGNCTMVYKAASESQNGKLMQCWLWTCLSGCIAYCRHFFLDVGKIKPRFDAASRHGIGMKRDLWRIDIRNPCTATSTILILS